MLTTNTKQQKIISKIDIIQEFQSNGNSSFTIFDHIINYELSLKGDMSNALVAKQKIG